MHICGARRRIPNKEAQIMMGQTAFSAYYWLVYVWFAVGVLLIAVPAVGQIIRVVRHK
jgi:hypothetical protein